MERLQTLISSRRRCRGDCRLDVMFDEIESQFDERDLITHSLSFITLLPRSDAGVGRPMRPDFLSNVTITPTALAKCV